MVEIWKDIKDYEGLYQVSNLGNVKSKRKVLSQNSVAKANTNMLMVINGNMNK